MADSKAEGGKEGNYGDSSGKLWTMYINQSAEYDKTLSESWRGDTDGIIVFTGLFSATVAAFIIESYKKLSSDSGDQTVALLTQLTNQLAALSNGTQLPAPDPLPSFTPSASAIRVNALWFLSLIMSITCALAATLMQQWARHYLQVSRRHAAPHKRARIRAYLFEGVKTFRMAGAVEFIPTLLHASVFLFFAGLVDFMISINTTVGYVILAFMTVSASAYVLLTVLPIAFLNSPFRTPISGLLWPAAHVVLLVALWITRNLVELLEPVLVGLRAAWQYQLPSTIPHGPSNKPRGPHHWKEVISATIKHCRRRFSLGMWLSVERSAAHVPWKVDVHALEWTLDVIDEDFEWEQFVDGIPGFAKSETVKHSKAILMDLMTPVPYREVNELPRLVIRISHLLETCYSGTGGLTEDVRNRRLLACVTAVWHIMEPFNEPVVVGRPPGALPYQARQQFGNSNLTRSLRTEADPRVVIVGRCMGALIARKLVRDIKSRLTQYDEAVSQILAELLDEPPSDVIRYVGNQSADLANLVSVVKGIVPFLAKDRLTPEVLGIVLNTLTLLVEDLQAIDHPDTRSPTPNASALLLTSQARDCEDDVRAAFFTIYADIEAHEKMQGDYATMDVRYVPRFTRLAELLYPLKLILPPAPPMDSISMLDNNVVLSASVSQFPLSESIRSGSPRGSMLLRNISAAGSAMVSSRSGTLEGEPRMSMASGASVVVSRAGTLESDFSPRVSAVVSRSGTLEGEHGLRVATVVSRMAPFDGERGPRDSGLG